MNRFVTSFLLSCLVGAVIFLVLLFAVSLKVYVTSVLIYGLFGAVVDWAWNGEEN